MSRTRACTLCTGNPGCPARVQSHRSITKTGNRCPILVVVCRHRSRISEVARHQEVRRWVRVAARGHRHSHAAVSSESRLGAGSLPSVDTRRTFVPTPRHPPRSVGASSRPSLSAPLLALRQLSQGATNDRRPTRRPRSQSSKFAHRSRFHSNATTLADRSWVPLQGPRSRPVSQAPARTGRRSQRVMGRIGRGPADTPMTVRRVFP